jgi:hypothetical protein
MHKQIIGNDSEFCGCEKEFRTVVFIPTADGGKTTLHGETYEEPPELCQTCGKPNQEPIHFTFTINPGVKLTGEA